jgi:hypothetical protein
MFLKKRFSVVRTLVCTHYVGYRLKPVVHKKQSGKAGFKIIKTRYNAGYQYYSAFLLL